MLVPCHRDTSCAFYKLLDIYARTCVYNIHPKGEKKQISKKKENSRRMKKEIVTILVWNLFSTNTRGILNYFRACNNSVYVFCLKINISRTLKFSKTFLLFKLHNVLKSFETKFISFLFEIKILLPTIIFRYVSKNLIRIHGSFGIFWTFKLLDFYYYGHRFGELGKIFSTPKPKNKNW